MTLLQAWTDEHSEPFAEAGAAAKAGPTLVFVAGVSRSGTSVLTRLISLCGATLPRQLLGPNSGNPTGHWEPLAALRLNDAYLAAHKSSWFDPSLRLQVNAAVPPADRAEFIAKIRRFLEREFRAGDVLVIKEPRILALFDDWLAAARQSGIACRIVHVYRHPEEVAASLGARDRLTRDHSYLLWVKYNLLAERHARGCARVFLSYDALLRDWRGALDGLIGTFGLEARLALPSSAQDVLFADLRHHVAPARIVDDPTPGRWAERIYGALQNAAEEVDMASLDDVLDEYVGWDIASREAAVSRSRLWMPLASYALNLLRRGRRFEWRYRYADAFER